jgi:hypothetical protein
MFHNERGLLNDITFRRDKDLIYEAGIPLLSGVI